ncbi:MAG: VCBS repeat-containing protein, partial [Flavobacteriales bacterium]|nr:VCBS repeat-containing protein [Flavobacteriales bacterium]
WTGSIANTNNNNLPFAHNRGNMIVINNIWGVNEYLGRYVVENWDQNRTTNTFNITSTGDLLTSATGYKYGDFNGNGQTDILKIKDNKWSTIPLNIGSFTEDWQQVNTSTADPTLLKVGCFNNDSKSDIFYGNGSTWRYASGATGNWITYATSNASPIRLGRFHRNGYSDYIWDVFYSNSSTWSVSHDGSSWQQINTSSADKNFLRLGDFNGDGISDVFYAYGPSTNTWKVSYSGTNNFVTINNSGYSAYDVILADFDQDNSTAGITDVIANNGQYQISIGGTSSWTPLFTSNFPRSSFGYGNLK